MPKIFLIKNRLHQQQLKLLESQNLIQSKNDDSFNIEYNSENRGEPLSLVAKKQSGKWSSNFKDSEGTTGTSNATGKITVITSKTWINTRTSSIYIRSVYSRERKRGNHDDFIALDFISVRRSHIYMKFIITLTQSKSNFIDRISVVLLSEMA